MPATAIAAPGDNNPQNRMSENLALANAPEDRLMIRKDLAHFEARIASYPDEVRDDVIWLYQFNQSQFSGHYPLLANLVRNEAKMELSDQYFYQVLGGKYFRRDPKDAKKVLGSVDRLKEVVEWLRRWAIFNSEAGGMPFVETPTWHELNDYITATCAPENPCKFGAVCGSTGTGKSRMLKRYALLNNHGMTAHTARAGHGKGVKTASCTSDGLTAALRAAGKWFDLPESQIVVARTTERGYTARPIRAHEVFTEIEFEDRGQDFIRWTVAGDGTVYDCQPCQSWVWCGGRVLNMDALRVGGLVKFASYQDSITVAYRIVNLNRRDASS